MVVSPLASSSQARDQGSVPGTENKPVSAAADFANLVQTATKNFASSMATQSSEKRAALMEKATTRPSRTPPGRPDAVSTQERPAQTQKRDDARKPDDVRPQKDKTSRLERNDPQQGGVEVSPPVPAQERAAMPQAPVATPEGENVVASQEAGRTGGALPTQASSSAGAPSGAPVPAKAGDGAGPVPADKGAALPVDLTAPDAEGEAALLRQASGAPVSTQAQAQAETLARMIGPGAAPMRVNVTTEQKAPVAYSTSNVSGQAVAVAQALSGADGEAAMNFSEQNAYSGGQGGNAGLFASSGQAAPTQGVAPQPFFGVANAPAFVVPTMNPAAAVPGGQATVPPPAANGAMQAATDAADALLSQPGATLAAGQDGTGGADRLGGNVMADFSQTLRGAAKGDAAAQPYTQRPVVQSSPDQVHVHIRKAFGDGADRITIQLRPAHLGRIDVRIETAQDGSVTAHIQADKAETLDMMARDARSLEQALKDAGLQADRDSLNFSLRGEERQHAERNDDNGRRSGRNSSHATDGGEETPDLASSDAAGPNDDGSLDIRV